MFVVRFPGGVGHQDAHYGNMIVVIGTILGARADTLTGVPVRRLTLDAQCFHVWRSQGQSLDDFPWLPNTRYWPLIEQTYCTNRPKVILPVS